MAHVPLRRVHAPPRAAPGVPRAVPPGGDGRGAAVLGVVVAGLAIPFAGLAGIGARNVARTMDNLPEELKTEDLAAADHDPRRERQPAGLALRREPDHGPAQGHLADHGQGAGRDRGLPLLPARRARPEGHAARADHQPGQQRRGPGWLVDHPAAGQADPHQPGQDEGREAGRHRRHLRAQAQGAALRDRAGAEPLQGLDPRALPQHGVLRRRGVRRPGGGEALLRRQRPRPQPAPVRAARRPGQEPLRLRPDQVPRPRDRAARRRPGPDGRAQRGPARQGREEQAAATSGSTSRRSTTAA